MSVRRNHELDDLAAEWLALDPDPVTRGELEQALSSDDQAALEDRFDGRLEFGTAGIRGAQGAGPNRMNRVTVRRMAAGIGAYLGPGASVVIGYDARHNSDTFAADAADVLASMGVSAGVIDGHVPTPVVSYAVRSLGAQLGLMVTASHNPPADNGCKVFLADGAQLRAPIDFEIEAEITAAEIPARELGGPTHGAVVSTIDRAIVSRYIDRIVADVDFRDDVDVRVAYTPLHGVGRDVLVETFVAALLPAPTVVGIQGDPDPDFPTVNFPNPEEPGAMDAVIALAEATGADLAIANDPDGDRLAVAVPSKAGEWRSFTGDEVGALLCDRLIQTIHGSSYKVVSTVVCSSLVAKVAERAGLVHRTTLTGFKWIMAEAYADPDLVPLLAYEESLGYALTRHVRDKDGISAALWFVELTDVLKQRGSSPARRLDELAVEHGLHATRQFSVRFAGPGAVEQAGEAVQALRRNPPSHMAGSRVVSIVDYIDGGDLPPTNLLRFNLEGNIRVLVRPSGTEPKTKLYIEHVVDIDDVSHAVETRAQALATIDAMRTPLEELLLADRPTRRPPGSGISDAFARAT